jgi:hypothetical protein
MVWTAEGSGFDSRYGRDFSLFSTPSRPALGNTHLIPKLLSPEVQRPGCEAQHSTPTSAEDKNILIYTSFFPYVFMAY